MTQVDNRLRAALDADDEAFLNQLDSERGLFAQVGDTLSGPLGGWAKLVFGLAFLLAVVMFYTVYRMVIADSDREFLVWALGALAAFVATGFVKQWFFERMNLNTVLRELKHIELRIARIEER